MWDLVLLRCPFFSKIKDKAAYIHRRTVMLVKLIRIAMVLSFIAWFFFAKTGAEFVILTLALVTFLVVCFLDSVACQAALMFSVILLLSPLLLIICCFNCMCKRKPRHDPANNPPPVADQNNNIAPIQAAVPVPGIIELQQAGNIQVVQPGDDEMINILRLFVNQLGAGIINQPQLQRVDTDKAVTMMLNHWKRKYHVTDTYESPACCVCLEPFLIDEEIIELHCNPQHHGHIFHPICIDGWSKKQKTCPL